MDAIFTSLDQGALNLRIVAEIKHRFEQVNSNRLTRMQAGLQSQQRMVLDIIPLLFHVNHNRMPGWFDGDTPAGIQGYKLSENHINLAKKVSPAFHYNGGMVPNAPIESLFVMGSVGTIAQSTSSDLDFWLCYSASLDEKQVQLLDQKAKLISKWAAGFNMEVHFFLMNARQFKSGQLSTISDESSGSTQHHLLLDEFYRTNVLMAGAYPAWWLVAPGDEQDYDLIVQLPGVEQLKRNGTVIDFGHLADLPAGEFVGAGMWQLYKSIQSPHKSLMKLLLMELYAAEYPDTRCLGLDFKKRVYTGILDLDELDPYVMLYRRIEKYLLSIDEPDRLEQVRQAFYLKTGLNLSRKQKSRSSSWRRSLMNKLITEWGWTQEQILELDERHSWSFRQFIDERKGQVQELTRSYSFLNSVAKQLSTDQLANPREILILGRQLNAAFEGKPEKIEMLNAHNEADFSVEKLRFVQTRNGSRAKPVWTAQIGAVKNVEVDPDLHHTNFLNLTDKSQLPSKPKGPPPLKTANGLMEVIAWSYFNRLLDAHLNVPFVTLPDDNRTTLTDFELKSIISSMRQEWKVPLDKIPQSNFHKPSRPVQISLYVNVGLDPLPYLTAKGLQKLSSRNDSLDFSALRENLIQSIDMVMLTSWNEVVIHRFEAQESTMIECLQFTLSQIARGVDDGFKLYVHCFSNTRPAAISQRVNDLFSSVIDKLMTQGKVNYGRYVVAMSNQFHVLQFREQSLAHRIAVDETELLEILGESQQYHSPISLDNWALRDKPELKLVLSNIRSTGLQLFFARLTNQMARVYVVDEFGSLWSYTCRFHNLATLVLPLYRFVRMVEYRQNSDQYLDDEVEAQFTRQTRFYEYIPASQEKPPRLEVRKPTMKSTNVDFYNIKATVYKNTDGHTQYQVSYKNGIYDSNELGEGFYLQIAAALLVSREGRPRLPCYVTELDISDEIKVQLPFGRAQTMDYFRFKHRIESRVNLAIQRAP